MEQIERIDVTTGSYIISPENVSVVASVMAHELRKLTGIGLMDAKVLLLANGMDLVYCEQYVNSGEMYRNMKKRGVLI